MDSASNRYDFNSLSDAVHFYVNEESMDAEALVEKDLQERSR